MAASVSSLPPRLSGEPNKLCPTFIPYVNSTRASVLRMTDYATFSRSLGALSDVTLESTAFRLASQKSKTEASFVVVSIISARRRTATHRMMERIQKSDRVTKKMVS